MDRLDFDFVINNNNPLNVTWSQFETPIIQYTTIDSDGYGEEHPLIKQFPGPTEQIFFRAELNAVELRPPHMDASGRTKYPVLFRVYG